MRIPRHSKIAITMDIYIEVVSSATREALRKLGDQLGPGATTAQAAKRPDACWNRACDLEPLYGIEP
jgi:hypothetical protein